MSKRIADTTSSEAVPVPEDPGGFTGGFTGPDRAPNAKPAAEKKARRGPDPELQAMAKIDLILSEFDESGQARIMAWIMARKMKMATMNVQVGGGDKS